MELKPFSESINVEINTKVVAIDTYANTEATALSAAGIAATTLVAAKSSSVKKALSNIAKSAGVQLTKRGLSSLNSLLFKVMGPIWNVQIAENVEEFLVSQPSLLERGILSAYKSGSISEEDAIKLLIPLKEHPLKPHLITPIAENVLRKIIQAVRTAKEKGESLETEVERQVKLLKKGAYKTETNIIPHGEFYHKDVGWY